MGMIDWESLVGEDQVAIHSHAPMSRKLGYPVYSVLRGNRVIGQTTGGALEEPQVHVNRFQFVQAINNPNKAKTRNTLIVGKPVSSAPEGDTQPLEVRTGKVSVGGKPIFEVPTEQGTVRLRENIPKAERTPGGPGTRLGKPFTGRMVPQGTPMRSDVFAAGVIFGQHGVSAVNVK